MDRAKAAEDEYFKQEEAETRRYQDWEEDRQRALAQQGERERAVALQVRRCPKCRIALEPQQLGEVPIERCNSCNGVWLDEGRLERLMQPEQSFVKRILRALRTI
jgi:hypothetical protein